MKNIVVLYKDEDGDIYCHQITNKGKDYYESGVQDHHDMWETGGTILLNELEEILDREI